MLKQFKFFIDSFMLRIRYVDAFYMWMQFLDESLKEAEEAAKTAEKGVWSPTANEHVRDVKWEVDNPRQLVDKMQGKPINAVIENVRDGSTVRAFLLPDYYHVTLMMSGVKVNEYSNKNVKMISPILNDIY